MRFTTALAIAVISKGVIYLEGENEEVRTAAMYDEDIFRDIAKKKWESSIFIPTPDEVIQKGWKVIYGKNPKKIARLLKQFEDHRDNDSPDAQQPNG